MQRYVCETCAADEVVRSFASQYGLRRHLIDDHSNSTISRSKAYKCVEDECSFASSRVEELVAHLEEVHGFAEFRIETKEFVSFEAFLTWKQRIEETTSTQFVRSHGPRPTTKGGKNHEMHCHRTERSSRCKTGEAFKCSCFIKVSEDSTGQCTATFCLQHICDRVLEDLPKRKVRKRRNASGLCPVVDQLSMKFEDQKNYILQFLERVDANQTPENLTMIRKVCGYVKKLQIPPDVSKNETGAGVADCQNTDSTARSRRRKQKTANGSAQVNLQPEESDQATNAILDYK